MRVSINQLSDLTGFDRRTISRRLESLTPEKEGRSHLYESRDALRLAYGAVSDGDSLDLSQERAHLALAQRKLAEIKRKELERDLIPAAEVVQFFTEAGMAAKQVMLGVPSRLASVLVGIDDRHKIYSLVDAEVRYALFYLSDMTRIEGGPIPYEKYERQETADADGG